MTAVGKEVDDATRELLGQLERNEVDVIELPNGSTLRVVDVERYERLTGPDRFDIEAEKESGHVVELREYHIESAVAAGSSAR